VELSSVPERSPADPVVATFDKTEDVWLGSNCTDPNAELVAAPPADGLGI